VPQLSEGEKVAIALKKGIEEGSILLNHFLETDGVALKNYSRKQESCNFCGCRASDTIGYGYVYSYGGNGIQKSREKMAMLVTKLGCTAAVELPIHAYESISARWL